VKNRFSFTKVDRRKSAEIPLFQGVSAVFRHLKIVSKWVRT